MPSSDAVLFDLDGTLVDTAPDFIYCINLLRHRRGLPTLPDGSIRPFVSNGTRAMIQAGFGLTGEALDNTPLIDEFLDLYAEHLTRETRLFPALEQTLDWLDESGIAWGIVTNKPRRFSSPLIAGLGLEKRCRALVCPDDVIARKPDPESLLLACRQLDALPTASLYVGDHFRDIEAGRRAGMKTLAAAWGYIDDIATVADWQADTILAQSTDLLPWLKRRYATARSAALD
ncbi:HAD-IA family hydrolase [Mangrovitalea sediminis]|uniref:HAD-IA family hydrolase n=1 Tax=Mangrovitalea sediminis TaxID=1982043 RepID=UPI000BE574AC|nr:HAD-IA family hydrolase [Mangrovitalea sediminis]